MKKVKSIFITAIALAVCWNVSAASAAVRCAAGQTEISSGTIYVEPIANFCSSDPNGSVDANTTLGNAINDVLGGDDAPNPGGTGSCSFTPVYTDNHSTIACGDGGHYVQRTVEIRYFCCRGRARVTRLTDQVHTETHAVSNGQVSR